MSSPLSRPQVPSEVPDPGVLQRLAACLDEVLRGKPEVVRQVLAAMLARGHVLVEDVPGVGKTTLGQGLAGALGCTFRRIQFTSDLLPADVVGVSVFDAALGEFRFRPGPIFAHVVLADEVNRATPRTQSALLEAMNEGQVSVDGVTHPLPRPFMVIATQNPVEHVGTFPLPESQLDRFLVRLRIGYPDREAERQVLRQGGAAPRGASPVLGTEDLLALQRAADGVEIGEEVEDYLLAIVEATRRCPDLDLGVSPRGTQALGRAARARALLLGRAYVVPDDVKAMAVPVLAHRVVPAGALDGRRGEGIPTDRLISVLVQSVSPPR